MLTLQQMEHFRDLLMKRHVALSRRLVENHRLGMEKSSIHSELGELSSYDNHPADHGSELFARELDVALLEHEERELADIEEALQRIRKGTYGICEVCGQEIPLGRLQAMPTATRCKVHAQQRPSRSRPVEEEVLRPPFGKWEYDEQDTTMFDAEDAWQEVSRHGTSETPSDFADPARFSYQDMILEGDEAIGHAEEIEGFLITDIHGDHQDVYPNALHQAYEETLDEAGEMSILGTPAPEDDQKIEGDVPEKE